LNPETGEILDHNREPAGDLEDGYRNLGRRFELMERKQLVGRAVVLRF
jgi:hypothetical protein